MVVRRAQSGHGLEPQRHRAHRGSDLCVLRASVVNLVCGRRWVMKSRSESRKGERLILGSSTPGLVSEEPPGRPGKRLEGAFGARFRVTIHRSTLTDDRSGLRGMGSALTRFSSRLTDEGSATTVSRSTATEKPSNATENRSSLTQNQSNLTDF